MSRPVLVFCFMVYSIYLTGCARPISVTYHSDPPGAILYQGNQRFGYAPQTLMYNVSDLDHKLGYMYLQGTSMVWASGAKAEIASLPIFLGAETAYNYSFKRPDGVPGREADMLFSIEVERNAIMRQQAQAQEDQAAWQMYNSISQQFNQLSNCNSTLTGNTVYTNCY